MAADMEMPVHDRAPKEARVPLRGPTVFLLVCAIVALTGVVTFGLPLSAGIFEVIATR